jgi:type I site-specific restriction-modification system R (restriction) subunit
MINIMSIESSIGTGIRTETGTGTETHQLNSTLMRATLESTLDEYVKTTRAIENIQNKINIYKKNIEHKIKNSKSTNEQNKKIKEFKKTIAKLKNDSEIIQKYKLLKKRKNELKEILISINLQINNNQFNADIVYVDKIITDLRIKYMLLAQENNVN